MVNSSTTVLVNPVCSNFALLVQSELDLCLQSIRDAQLCFLLYVELLLKLLLGLLFDTDICVVVLLKALLLLWELVLVETQCFLRLVESLVHLFLCSLESRVLVVHFVCFLESLSLSFELALCEAYELVIVSVFSFAVFVVDQYRELIQQFLDLWLQFSLNLGNCLFAD